MTNRCLWKHYLPATTVEGSNNNLSNSTRLRYMPKLKLIGFSAGGVLDLMNFVPIRARLDWFSHSITMEAFTAKNSPNRTTPVRFNSQKHSMLKFLSSQTLSKSCNSYFCCADVKASRRRLQCLASGLYRRHRNHHRHNEEMSEVISTLYDVHQIDYIL